MNQSQFVADVYIGLTIVASFTATMEAEARRQAYRYCYNTQSYGFKIVAYSNLCEDDL